MHFCLAARRISATFGGAVPSPRWPTGAKYPTVRWHEPAAITHFPDVRSFLQPRVVGALFCVLCVTALSAAGTGGDPANEPLLTVQMSSPTGLNPQAELLYTPSNDGHPFRSGPPESFQTVVHMIADPVLEPWKVVRGDQVIPRAGARVTLEREASHTIRFGSTPE